jgi:predicted ATPase
VADDRRDRTRYRLLETVRQYALEKLGESGEADGIRTRHRDYYTSIAAVVDAPAGRDYEQRLERAELEIDNLRAAFGWSCENSDTALALALPSSLQPLWFARGRVREGLAWFNAVLTHDVEQDAEVTAGSAHGRWPTKQCWIRRCTPRTAWARPNMRWRWPAT